MRVLARLFKSLADESRLKMMALLLAHEELCVCDLQKALLITQSKASRHLQYMKQAGLLTDRREALWVHYRVERDVSDDRRALLEVLRRLLRGSDLAVLEKRLSRWLSRKVRQQGRCGGKVGCGRKSNGRTNRAGPRAK
jgi:ArsR family transcriptional regulator, arsenate/arsenite/antimonite-responsive transcriptional repressor